MCHYGLAYTRETHRAKSSIFPWAPVATVHPRAANVSCTQLEATWAVISSRLIAVLPGLAECLHRHL